MKATSEPYRKAVVAVEGDDGAVLYQYGWVRSVEFNMGRDEMPRSRWDMFDDPHARRFADPDYTTVVEWAGTVHQSYRYPTADDFAAALPAGQRALPC